MKKKQTENEKAVAELRQHRAKWLEENFPSFKEENLRLRTWVDEIAYVESLGYEQVPPAYHLPHWSVVMRMGEELPLLYCLKGGTDLRVVQMLGHLDRRAEDLGYPVYYKPRKPMTRWKALLTLILGAKTL